MLNRQRIVLYFLKKAGGSASRIALVKWCFLLRQETQSKGGNAFYDFLPYKFGPYSFCLQHEISQLVQKGILQAEDARTWKLGPEFKDEYALPHNLEDAALIMVRYRAMSTQELMHKVYSEHPWYGLNSDRLRMNERIRPRAGIAVYTIGYEGLSVDRFLNKLVESGIKCVADVRSSPLSRRFGFHRSTLSRLCKNVGIGYRSFGELGIESAQRQNLRTMRDYQALFEKYRVEVLDNCGSSLERLAEQILNQPTALLCMEADWRFCHRSVLADQMSKALSLAVTHIGGKP